MKKVLLICLVLLSNLAFSQTDEQLEAARNSDAGLPLSVEPKEEKEIWAAGHLFNRRNPMRINPDGSMRFVPNLPKKPGDPQTISIMVRNNQVAPRSTGEFVEIEAELPQDVRCDWKKIFADPKDGYVITDVKGVKTLTNAANQVRFVVVQKTLCENALNIQRGETTTPVFKTRYFLYVKALYEMQ